MNNEFTFNSKTSVFAYEDDVELNRKFIAIQERNLNLTLIERGYIYLNQIYESFGVKWDPDLENLCLLYSTGVRLKLGIARQNDDGFDIDIL